MRRPAVAGLYEHDGQGRPVLLVGRCGQCGARSFPAVSSCPECSAPGVEIVRYGPHARIFAYTIVHEVFGQGSLPLPYAVARVEFDDGYQVRGLLDPEVGGWRVGQEVETREICLDRDGDDDLLTYAFTPRRGHHA
jgi:uncharacterized OB-fold protein